MQPAMLRCSVADVGTSGTADGSSRVPARGQRICSSHDLARAAGAHTVGSLHVLVSAFG